MASAGLLGIAGLHVIWATGSSWPLPDAGELADVVAGRPAGRAPSPAACLAAVLSTRGALGMAGRTDLLAPGSTSERFRRRDRMVYSPVCLTLAALAAPAVRSAAQRPPS